MGRGRIFIYLGLIVILGLVAVAVLATQTGLFSSGGDGGTVTEPTPPPIPEVIVIATTNRVPRGAVITDDVITELQFPENLLVEGMYTNRDDVVGLMAKYDLDSSTYLTTGNLVSDIESLSSAGSVAALLIPKGMVAVSIPVSRLTSVGFGLETGDEVNIIVTMPFVDLDPDFQSVLPNSSSSVIGAGPAVLLTDQSAEGGTVSQLIVEEGLNSLSALALTGRDTTPQGRVELDNNLNQPFYIVASEPQRPRLVSQTLIQGAIVLKLGTFVTPEEEAFQALQEQQAAATQEAPPETTSQQPADQTTTEPAAPKPPDIISLVVSPQDAVTLNYLIYTGAQLSLAMRASEDDSRVDTEAVTLQFLLDEYNIPVPAKLPYGTEPRIDEIVDPIAEIDAVPTPTPTAR
jgi:pilus assembly protein CpaB